MPLRIFSQFFISWMQETFSGLDRHQQGNLARGWNDVKGKGLFLGSFTDRAALKDCLAANVTTRIQNSGFRIQKWGG
ncbi:MAG: hypothetical protein C0613_01475 [Desulfobulbaceae bacterium]|nr:MAG: hypothetical protein C0613_01475 [Desulfobulbaceae bacterium]